MAFTLFPKLSNLGETIEIIIRLGTTTMSVPPIPDFAGKPSVPDVS